MTHRLPSIVVACFTIIIFLPQPSAAEFTKSTYVYKTVDGTKIEADVFRENDKKKRPVIVWIHGGALIVGSRTSIPGNLLELAKTEGYTLVSIDYRLAPEVRKTSSMPFAGFTRKAQNSSTPTPKKSSSRGARREDISPCSSGAASHPDRLPWSPIGATVMSTAPG